MAEPIPSCVEVVCKPDNYGRLREMINGCKWNLFNSGIAEIDTTAQSFAQGTSWSANEIFWADTVGYDEEGQIPGGADEGCLDCESPCQKELTIRKLQRNKCFYLNDFVKQCNRAPESGEQIIAEIINKQQTAFREGAIMSTLLGIQASNVANYDSDMIFDATDGGAVDPATGGWFDYPNFIEGGGGGGCCVADLECMLMHCDVVNDLKKCEQIDTIQASAVLGNSSLCDEVMVYNKKRIVETNDPRLVDMTNPDAPCYTTVMFRHGMLRMGNGEHCNPLEQTRIACHDNGDGQTVFNMREIFALHPEGFTNCWTPTAFEGGKPKVAPANAELALAATWERCWDPQNIGLRFMKTYAGKVITK